VALCAAGLALALVPVVPAGVPVIAAAGVAVVAGLLPERRGPAQRSEVGQPATRTETDR
jgi:hypothetical protein